MQTTRTLRGWISVALACAALHATAALAQGTDARKLQRIDYAALSGGRTVVRLTFDTELTERPPVIATHHPTPNIALDFAGTATVVGREAIEVGQRELHSIQILGAVNRVRVVVKLTRPVPHEIEIAGRELLLTLHRPVQISDLDGRPTTGR